MRVPRSAYFISVMLNIPLGSSYKRINALLDAGVLEIVDRPFTAGGARVYHYRSCIQCVHLKLENEGIFYQLYLRGGLKVISGTVHSGLGVREKD